jgi:hypothetical protein
MQSVGGISGVKRIAFPGSVASAFVETQRVLVETHYSDHLTSAET